MEMIYLGTKPENPMARLMVLWQLRSNVLVFDNDNFVKKKWLLCQEEKFLNGTNYFIN